MTEYEEEGAHGEQVTWTEPGIEPIDSGQVIDTRTLFTLVTEHDERKALRDAQSESRRHFMRMQLRVLTGVGLIFFCTILTLVIGLWRHLIPLPFGTELMRTVVPPVLGAGLTIVGAFFHNGGGPRGP